MRTYLLAIAVALEFLLVACASQEKTPPQDWISQQWARSMAAYNILPIYPPTEDVYVGDIYAYGVDQTGVEGNLFSSIKIDSVSVEPELEEVYSQHPIFPDTTAKPSTTNDIWEQPGTDAKPSVEASAPDAPAPKQGAGGAKNKQKKPAGPVKEVKVDQANPVAKPETKPPVSIFANSTTRTKLALIVFPAFTLANASAESLGVSVPLRFFQAIFGASKTQENSITIKITAAETYGLPARVAREKFALWCKTAPTDLSCTKGNARFELGSLRSLPANARVGLAFVNRVYLARSIEYTYDATTAAGVSGDLTVTLQKALENQKALQTALTEKAASGAVGASAPAGGASGAAGASAPAADDEATLKDIHASLDALLAQLQKVNEQATGSSAPGASFTVGTVSSQGVTLIQTFERPVAIGYRAITLSPP